MSMPLRVSLAMWVKALPDPGPVGLAAVRLRLDLSLWRLS